MKILLILPAAQHLRVTRQNQAVPKRKMLRFSVLSLTTIAALTPRQHEVTICDENVEAIDLGCKPDIVGITFMTGLAPRAYELAAHFRKKGIITVAGGYHPTLCTAEVSEHFDIVVVGQAEGVWQRVLEDIAKGTFEKIYHCDPNLDLAAVPEPRREILSGNAAHYATISAVQTGRGCNHACKFCSVSAFFNHQYHQRPLGHVIDELRKVPRNFMFVDDNIIADRPYAVRLFKSMIPMRKRWISQCSIEIADDPELLGLARRAGCRGLFIGIETTNAKNLAEMDKEFNDPGNYARRIKAIRKAGIGVQAGVIVGLDSDDVTVFEQTLKFLQQNRIDALQLAILTPQPGTRLREEFESSGRIIDYDWSHYDYRHTVIQPAKMTPGQLQNGADWLYNQYYRLDRIIIRTARAIFDLGPITAYIVWRLNMTYRYDNLREGIIGANPATSRWTLSKLGELFRRLIPAAVSQGYFSNGVRRASVK